MNPIIPNITQRLSVATDTAQLAVEPKPPSQHGHPDTLSPALLSKNAFLALAQAKKQPDEHHKLLARLTINSIEDSALQILSTLGADVIYKKSVHFPNGDAGNLTVNAQLNNQAQYDIVSVNLYKPTSAESYSIYLSGRPADTSREQTDSYMHAGPATISSLLAAHYTRAQLANALILMNNPQDFTEVPLPSGVSVNTQTTVFSDEAPEASQLPPGSYKSSQSRTS